MSQMARLYRIEQMLNDREHVTFKEMIEALEVSAATLKRDLSYLRDRLNAPIEYDRFTNGYRFAAPYRGSAHALPGLWFAPEEIRALLTMQHLLEGLDSGGILAPHIAPLMARIRNLMGSTESEQSEVSRRVKIVMAGQHRKVAPACFQVVGNALMMRKRLRFGYFSRHRDEHGEREASPQRLSYYRDNWYLDAWCHTAKALRMFSLDAMSDAVMLETTARDASLARVQQELGVGYGIYNGTATTWAVLRFSPASARWVASEHWHPRQKSRQLPDGGLEIEVPYLNPTELVMDILRHGEHVRVLSPPALKAAVKARLDAARSQYGD